MYVDGEQYGYVRRFVVANYKKDGGCPCVNPDRHPYLGSSKLTGVPRVAA
jgi:hypothetical protein